MYDVFIKRATDQKHKYKAIIYKNEKKIKTVQFGSYGMSDFTIHKNEERRKRYIARHKTNENWSDIFSPGFWSRFLLWEKPTIAESKKYISKNFNINFPK